MKNSKTKYLIFIILLICPSYLLSQIGGYIKSGVNIGTINQEWWILGSDSIKYEKALIRPFIGFGGQIILSKNWILRQGIIFQIKGQGTNRPNVRSGFRYSDPDIIRFIGFPFSISRRLFSDFNLAVGLQPSIMLSGSDNYYAKEIWRGGVWGSVISLEYLKSKYIIGIEYDYDFTLYYCPACNIRFNTIRFYGMYIFL